jgi:hypothetical protein
MAMTQVANALFAREGALNNKSFSAHVAAQFSALTGGAAFSPLATLTSLLFVSAQMYIPPLLAEAMVRERVSRTKRLFIFNGATTFSY